MTEIEFLIIDKENSGRRLDNFLFSKFKKVPKSKIYSSIRKAKIKVNDKKSKPDYKLLSNDKVSFPIFVEKKDVSESPNLSSHLEIIKNCIIYDSNKYIVLNKPPNFSVHGGSGLNFGVIELIKKIYKNSENFKLAHRIDKLTSGCLVIAKKMSSLREMHKQFRNKEVKKIYECIVHGRWPEDLKKIETNIDIKQVNSERIAQLAITGKESLTKFTYIKHSALYSHIIAIPITGRTHQIRLHCSSAGYPIVGDQKYSIKKFANPKCRMMLHAREINFFEDGKKVKVVSEDNHGFGENLEII